MTKSGVALLLATVVGLAAAAPALAQAESYRTPAPTPASAEDCDAAIDCVADLDGGPAPSRPSRVWAVRSSHAPADADLAPPVGVAVLLDLDTDRHDWRDRRAGRGGQPAPARERTGREPDLRR